MEGKPPEETQICPDYYVVRWYADEERGSGYFFAGSRELALVQRSSFGGKIQVRSEAA